MSHERKGSYVKDRLDEFKMILEMFEKRLAHLEKAMGIPPQQPMPLTKQARDRY